MAGNEIKSCTVCNTISNNKLLFIKNIDDKFNNIIKIYKCILCNGIYLGNYNEEYDDELYSYYTKYEGKTRAEVYDTLTRSSYLKVIKLLESYGSGKKVLDVGCGNGSFVSIALEVGYEVKGIELSQAAVDIARSFDLPVYKLDFFSKQIKESSYDVISMFEVLEHLKDPIGFLVRAEQVVKPGGLIYLTTPNYNSLDRRLLGKNWSVFHREHLTYLTIDSLIKAIKNRTQLEILSKETRNISIQLIEKVQNYFIKNVSLDNKRDEKEEIFTVQSSDTRTIIAKSRLLSFIKLFINFILNRTGTGTTIVMVLRRPKKYKK
jgi:2-polyprenyl-3-methyl-5-hydroxy-6-metoxy-1,4-benzoquinol methylase